MKKVLTWSTVLVFFSSIYLLPTLSAITLGEIKSDKSESVVIDDKAADGKTDKAVKKDDNGNKTDSGKVKKKDEKLPPEDKKKKVKEINPRLVCLLSVIMPGGGHFYLNNDSKGIAFCIAAGTGYTASGIFLIKTMLAERGSVAYRNYLLLTGFIFFITLIVHFVGIIEAYSDAEEINKKNLFKNSDDPFDTEVMME